MSHPRRIVAIVLSLALLAAACADDDVAGDAAPSGAESATATVADSTGDVATGVEGAEDADDEPGCLDDDGQEPIDPAAVASADLDDRTVTLVAYDSFVVSDGIFEAFEEETGITVEVLTSSDTGTMVSEAVLTAGAPVADVMWGIDNTFLCRGLDAGIFVPYTSPGLDQVPDDLELDPHHRVSPVDVSDLCVNVWPDALDVAVPETIDDLRRPEYASTFVTQNPETSAPGMGLLLATIATYGDDGWEDWWRDVADNGVTVTPGWSEAYYGEFVAGGGDKAIVMSYATSPVAELVFAETPLDEPPTVGLLDSCYRSIEFAGVLAGTDEPLAAARLVDFLLSTTMQEDIPLSMFVFPANEQASLPPEFETWAVVADDPLMIDPEIVEANRDDWTERWTEIVLR